MQLNVQAHAQSWDQGHLCAPSCCVHPRSFSIHSVQTPEKICPQ